jgi:hypothetical protein
MSASSLSARIRCKTKGCPAKVSLTPEQVRELSGSLQVRLTCPECGITFVSSLIPESRPKPTPMPDALTSEILKIEAPKVLANKPETPKASATKPISTKPTVAKTTDSPKPIDIPVPEGAKQARPPFRALPSSTEPEKVEKQAKNEKQAKSDTPFVRPPTDLCQNDLPFPPIKPGQASIGSLQTGTFGWWNRMSKGKQNLVLAGVFLLAVCFIGGIKFRDRIWPKNQVVAQKKGDSANPQAESAIGAPAENTKTTASPEAENEPGENPFNPNTRR